MLVCSVVFLLSPPAKAQVHPHHAAQIRKAAREVKPQVAPKKPNTVINGVTMCELEDRAPNRPVHGWLALQVDAGRPMRLQFKNTYLRRL
jgi:hypothetical protein